MCTEPGNAGKILIYQTEKGETLVDALFEQGEIWMTQRAMAELFQVSVQNITAHLKHIYAGGELDEKATCRKSTQVQTEGRRAIRRETKTYNLEAVQAVGYRVRSPAAMHFRRWATAVLSEFVKKGFALNDGQLADPKPFGSDYFAEQLERIDDICASKKLLCQKVKDIFALAADFEPKSKPAQNFFKAVQDRLQADAQAAAHTAPQADVSGDGLTPEEQRTLNLMLKLYLDYARLQARNHKVMYMSDWAAKLGELLRFDLREAAQHFDVVRRALSLEQCGHADPGSKPDAGAASAADAAVAGDALDELMAALKALH